MTWRLLLMILLWTGAIVHFAYAEEGSIRLRRVSPSPQKTSRAMKTQKEIAAKIKVQEEYYRVTSQLDRGEKRADQLKADLEFARIADPDRIAGIKKALKAQELQNVQLQREIFALHKRLTFTLKRSPASVTRPIRRSTR